MNKYDNELVKNSPSMIKGIAVEADRLNGGHHLSLTLDDVRVSFALIIVAYSKNVVYLHCRFSTSRAYSVTT